ncbi:MAG: tRNA lysidine(34) synthetase TilS [Pseudomonadota bacterium]
MRDLDRVIDAALLPDAPARLGVAVSGGGDSLALLVLLARFAKRQGLPLFAATVDHGLRQEAAAEARHVGSISAQLHVPHKVLKWDGWDGQGNLQDAARRARYGLLADWARSEGIPMVALGHTIDDQAETVLMRLGRAAGVEGLSAIPERFDRFDITWQRPLLGESRAALRDFLKSENIPWVDDPSNEDPAFDRIKARQALKVLAPLGITPAALAQTAENMRRARAALDARRAQVLKEIAQITAGAIAIPLARLQAEPDEIQRLALVSCLNWVARNDYSPRRRSVAAARQALVAKGSATLDGCRLLIKDGTLWVFREYHAVETSKCRSDQLWDGRWQIAGPDKGVEIAALGAEGLAQCSDWRATSLPRAALLATPAVWCGTEMVAAPVVDELLQRGTIWRAVLKKHTSELYETGSMH